MSNKETLIAKAFDSATGNSNLVHLNTKSADRFIDYVVDESVILKNSRVQRMNRPKQEVAKLSINNDIFYPASRGVAPSSSITASAEKITLSTKEIIGQVRIYDDELEDNIEGNAFKDHLMRMIAKKAANQLEKVALYGHNAGGVRLEDNFDGYVYRFEKEGNVLDVDTAGFADRYIDKEKLAKMRKLVPTKYRSLLDKWYMPDDLAVDFEVKYEATQNEVNRKGAFGIPFTKANLLKIDRPRAKSGGYTDSIAADATAGDTTIAVNNASAATIGMDITFNLGGLKEFSTTITNVDTSAGTITIEEALPFDLSASNTEENSITEVIRDGADIILTYGENLIWGIQRDITIEPDRQPKLRATDFVITARVDFAIENPEIGCLGKNFLVR